MYLKFLASVFRMREPVEKIEIQNIGICIKNFRKGILEIAGSICYTVLRQKI